MPFFISLRAQSEPDSAPKKIIAQPALAPYVAEELLPGPGVKTDAEFEANIRLNANSNLHPVGTCRMGPGPNTVVDDKLKVHGLDGLRIADASIFPTMPSGNTNAPSIMVGEKAADILKSAA